MPFRPPPAPTAGTVSAPATGPLDAGTVATQLAALASTVPSVTYTADHTLAAGDVGRVVVMDKATAIALTIPTDATWAAPVGTVLEVFAAGAGTVTVQAVSGTVTLQSANNTTTARALTGKYASAVLRKVATNTWVIAGLLT